MFLFSHITDTLVALVIIMCPDPPADPCNLWGCKAKMWEWDFVLFSSCKWFPYLHHPKWHTPSLRYVANWRQTLKMSLHPLSEMEQVLMHALNFQFVSRDPFCFQSISEQPHRKKKTITFTALINAFALRPPNDITQAWYLHGRLFILWWWYNLMRK